MFGWFGQQTLAQPIDEYTVKMGIVSVPKASDVNNWIIIRMII